VATRPSLVYRRGGGDDTPVYRPLESPGSPGSPRLPPAARLPAADARIRQRKRGCSLEGGVNLEELFSRESSESLLSLSRKRERKNTRPLPREREKRQQYSKREYPEDPRKNTEKFPRKTKEEAFALTRQATRVKTLSAPREPPNS